MIPRNTPLILQFHRPVLIPEAAPSAPFASFYGGGGAFGACAAGGLGGGVLGGFGGLVACRWWYGVVLDCCEG